MLYYNMPVMDVIEEDDNPAMASDGGFWVLDNIEATVQMVRTCEPAKVGDERDRWAGPAGRWSPDSTGYGRICGPIPVATFPRRRRRRWGAK